MKWGIFDAGTKSTGERGSGRIYKNVAEFTKNASEGVLLLQDSVVCPKCGQRTSFNLIQDAIDDEGEFYCCQHCGWPFHYKVAM